MIIRKFVILIASKFDPKGFRAADRSAKKLDRQVRKTARSIDKLAREEGKAARNARKMSAAQRKAARSAKQTKATMAKLAGSIKKLAPVAAAGGAALAGIGLAGAAVAKNVIEVGASFESLRAQLNNLLGSEAAGTEAFQAIRKFAKETPFQVEQITGAYIKLQNRGIKPTNERLTALGDIASASGKDLDQITEAALDATQGEGERLNEFGIRMQAAGDKVRLSFKGQTVEVKKNEEAITNALVGFGQMEGVAGSMAVQMDTTKGVVSNLKDSVANFFDEVAQLGVLDEFKALLRDIGEVGGGDGLAGILAKSLVTVLRSVREAIQSVTEEDVENFFRSVASAAEALATAVGFAVDAYRFMVDESGGLDEALINTTLLVTALIAAFTGPAGMVVAAAAVGAAVGRMLDEVTGLSDGLADALGHLTGLNTELRKLNQGKLAAERGAPSVQHATAAGERGAVGQANEGRAGGIGEGIEFQAGGRTIRGSLSAITDVASGKGAGEDPVVRAAASAALESALSEDIAANRAAGQRRARANAAKSGGGGGKKGKGKQFFAFEKKAAAAARSQGEAFAERELQRLISEGVGAQDAIGQARKAGRDRAAELKKRFIEAGKIFKAGGGGILEALGLTGPGSVLEGRPPPQTLLITISPVIKLIETFNQENNFSGQGGVQDATATGARAAVQNGLEPNRAVLMELWTDMLSLASERLLRAEGGGEQPAGVLG